LSIIVLSASPRKKDQTGLSAQKSMHFQKGNERYTKMTVKMQPFSIIPESVAMKCRSVRESRGSPGSPAVPRCSLYRYSVALVQLFSKGRAEPCRTSKGMAASRSQVDDIAGVDFYPALKCAGGYATLITLE